MQGCSEYTKLQPCATFCEPYKPFLPEKTAEGDASLPDRVLVLDPEIGWEQHKFVIAQTLLYLPENQKQYWLDMMRIYELGVDSDPGFSDRLMFQNPISGKTYIARPYGRETLFGKSGYEKGIAARMLQYANALVVAAFKLENDPKKLAKWDFNGDGQPDLPIAKAQPDGTPVIQGARAIGQVTCDLNVDQGCVPLRCEQVAACTKLQNYVEVLFLMRQAISAYGLTDFHKKGIYD
jgi:hypothetical protein